ncbi:hypothetical protein [Spirosoma fluviale]|uniref:Uncharacterized protein n=1 Tax=Spirosoma fluviale TaxID=1597977 RepID=A0A286FCR5_9BACT|nr:hypothetical protein [Spirosoma fluviale]SOD80990.1 hypothetical protein SAMN06269250_1637 [Spirosoma fluviale]
MTPTELAIEQLQGQLRLIEANFARLEHSHQQLQDAVEQYHLRQHFARIGEHTLFEAIANAIVSEYGITQNQLIGRGDKRRAGRRPLEQIKREHLIDDARIWFVALVRQLTPLITYAQMNTSYTWVQTRHFREAGNFIEEIYDNQNHACAAQWRHLLKTVIQQAARMNVNFDIVSEELDLAA